MAEEQRKIAQFFHEVWRRRVLQVAVPYLVAGWLLIEVSDIVLGAFEAPNWVLQAILVVYAIGLPIVVVLAWIFDITPTGLVRTSQQDAADAKSPGSGSAAEALPKPKPAPALALSMGDSERRQITLLNCAFDITPGDADEQDPEFLRDALVHLVRIGEDVAARYNAVVLPGGSEQLQLVFGYPSASDDDARRAVAAAEALLEAADQVDDNFDGCPDLALRIGVYTGPVVVEESEESGIRIIGQAQRFAAWLAEQAPDNVIALGQRTRELVARSYECRLLGRFENRQLGGEIEVYRIEGESSEPLDDLSIVPVGREQELALLQARWQAAMEGEGQFALVRGEPGIGKSSLIRLFQRQVQESGTGLVYSAFCSPYEQNTPLFPLVEALRRSVLQFSASDSNSEMEARIHGLAERLLPDDHDAPALLAHLLGVAIDSAHTALQDSAEQTRSRTLELLVRLIHNSAQRQPLLLLLEDLLWADPSTLEWIRLLIEEGPAEGLFILLSARPQFEADWLRRSYVLTLDLLPLTGRAARELVQQSAGDVQLPEALVERIVRETEGNPLYIHELTRAVIESGAWKQALETGGTDDLRWLKIPATLQDSLTARIDHLGPAKALLQLCSVLGREFFYSLLHAVSGTQNEAALKGELGTIVQSELLFRRGSARKLQLAFKHVLIQETAYNSLLRATRKELHGRTARIIEETDPDSAERQPALLAWHYGEAGETAKAVALWSRAASQSLAAYANLEAINQARRGLELLQAVPQGAERIGHEVALQATLGMALLATRGYAAPEVAEVFSRARQLCEQIGDSPQLFRVLVGLWMYNIISGRLLQSLELGESLMRSAEAGGDPGQLLQARYCRAYSMFYHGDFEAAYEIVLQAIADEIDDYDYAAQSASGDDTRSHLRFLQALLDWYLGRPQSARHHMQAALKLATDEGHPYGIAFLTFSNAWLGVICRDAAAALAPAREADELAQQHGYRFFQPLSKFMRAWAEGRADGGHEPIDSGVTDSLHRFIEQARGNGSRIGHSFLFCVLVEDLLALGRLEEAQDVLQLTATEMANTEEGHVAPEYRRLQARCHELQGDTGQAEAGYREAIAMAVHLRSPTQQLRAACQLVQLLDQQHRGDEVVPLLQQAFEGFAEADESSEYHWARKRLKT